jgi:ArsR family transcriptional regulator
MNVNSVKHLFDKAQKQSEFCNVFSNPRRIMIIWILEEKEMSVSDIAKNINASIQNTSQHLHILKNKEIVISRRVGQTIYYSLNENEKLHSCGISRRIK